uniref:Acyl-coenzyme A oxidase n=1 Tax=Albugo laibachii Nc14 TaxID=890382 RepID=F0WYA4_9STRA|nr:acylCoA dehydrogenase/oxidase putative [Albugo laibachii Nc14]|eukprot:CCA26456.1 acylCoA dehydrogenase/oxidase putative [Albugo laibachii Nc14]
MIDTKLRDLAPKLLQKERISGDINVKLLTSYLHGSLEANQRRKELLNLVALNPVLSDDRTMYRNHTERYAFALKQSFHLIHFFKKHHIESPNAKRIVSSSLQETLPTVVHDRMFIPTIELHGTPEQKKKWLIPAREYRIYGTYAQTELGHGSNVQGIETTAQYDAHRQEFIIHSPTFTSRKWWPGGLGKTANVAVVYARLLLDNGRDVGVHAFIVPLRSLRDHRPLKGIELGDIGPKVGFQAVDNGFCAFHHVRIPRNHMLMRFARVNADGSYQKARNSRLIYFTMLHMRVGCLYKCRYALARATTIATRFSAVRVQGNSTKSSGNCTELQVIEYQNQQKSLFPLIGMAFVALFVERMVENHPIFAQQIGLEHENLEFHLAELHAISSGLKGWLSEYCSNGVESCRRLCGGFGFLHSSNLPQIYNELVGTCTYEGTFDILAEQHARFLRRRFEAYETNNVVEGALCAPSVSFMSQWKCWLDPNLRCRAKSTIDLTDMELLREMFAVRATRFIARLASASRSSGGDNNANMALMMRVSRAHSELLMVTASISELGNFPAHHAKTKDVVRNSIVLLVLSLVEQNLADFREVDYMSTEQGDLVRVVILDLLSKIRNNAVLLTDAWDFMDLELKSAIGRYDGDIYRALVECAADEPLNKTLIHEGYYLFQKPIIQKASL